VVGQTGIEVLVAEIEGQQALPETFMVETRLVVRESTGPAPADAAHAEHPLA
jgi:DNA-binding LacI/PurR family transcriptional regulator